LLRVERRSFRPFERAELNRREASSSKFLGVLGVLGGSIIIFVSLGGSAVQLLSLGFLGG